MRNVKKISLSDTEMQQFSVYNNGKLAFFDNLKDMSVDMTKTFQSDIYIMVLVLEGKASLYINGTSYEIRQNDIFVCPPNNIIENCLLSVDFKCHCIGMSLEYVRQIVPMADNIWDIRILFEKNPVCTLRPDEVTVLCQYYDLLYAKVHLPSVTQGKVINALTLALIYDLQNIMNRVIRVSVRPFTSGEYLFKSFVEVLEVSYPKNRNVSHYAERLHVTPKYLSSVCKKVGGVTASNLIDRYVLKDIEYLMKHSSKTIKEMANELDFPSISFFGKYVKKHFGMAPRILRKQFGQED